MLILIEAGTWRKQLEKHAATGEDLPFRHKKRADNSALRQSTWSSFI